MTGFHVGHRPPVMVGDGASTLRSGYAAIVGRPNVGKSTLVNRLLGRKLCIISHKPQTTRHRILGIKTTSDYQIVFVDTPGIHGRGSTALNRYMNRAAVGALDGSDIVVLVIEAARWKDGDEQVLRRVRGTTSPLLLAINKVDRVSDKQALLPFMAEVSRHTGLRDLVPLSARRGVNVDALEAEIVSRLPPGAHLYPDGQLSNRSDRFFAAELIREQLTNRLSQELPYSLSVEIERFEDETDSTRIAATVWIERSSQKPIVVGRGGGTLKQVGIRARREIQAVLGRRVHLLIWVKTKERWSNDEQALMRLGYVD